MTENTKPIPSWAERKYTPVAKFRAKNYTMVLYPDDLPENWRDILAETMLNFVISPFHDKDINPDGTPKKPHYHALVNASGNWIAMNTLVELGQKLKGIAEPQKCSNPQGMVRYFTHMDNPEKAQYNQADIQVIGRYDISEFFKPTAGEDRDTRRQIIAFILQNGITELIDLVVYCIENNEAWDDYIARNTIYINGILKSMRHGNTQKFDGKPKT